MPDQLLRLVFLLLMLIAAPALADDATTIRLVAYNVENLFDVFDDPYTQDEKTPAKPRAAIRQVATAIRQLDGDLVAVSELENEGVLKALATESLHDLGYRHIVSLPSNDPRGITLGLLSRLPVDKVTSYRWRDLTLAGEDGQWEFARDVLHVQVQATPARVMHVLVVHFKSKRTVDDADPQSTKWRQAEAAMVRKIVAEIQADEPEAWITVAGDFNDTPQSQPMQTLTAGPDDASRLHDTHDHIDAEKRITYLSEPYRSTIDYVLVSKPLAGHVVESKTTLLRDEKLLSGSDHAPLVTTFALPREDKD